MTIETTIRLACKNKNNPAVFKADFYDNLFCDLNWMGQKVRVFYIMNYSYDFTKRPSFL